MTDNRYADLENRGRSEYGRAGDGDYINPAGQHGSSALASAPA